MNEVLAGVLAKAAMIADVQLHGYVALSNHVHLLVTARGNSLSRFMQYFLGNAARKLGRLVQWSGSFWQRRFSAEPVLDDEAALGRLRYLLSHGVKEGLVRTPEEWPGLSCLDLLRSEKGKLERFFRWEHRWKKGALVEGGEDIWDERWAEEVPLKLVPLPCWANLSFEDRQRQLQSLIDDIILEWAPRHAEPKGAQAVQVEDPHHRPSRTKKSPRPLCHVSTREGFFLFRERLRGWIRAFAQASASFRQGNWNVEFPPWAFRPPAACRIPVRNQESLVCGEYQVCGT
jgi:REP element-mobilizing transposase RayT